MTTKCSKKPEMKSLKVNFKKRAFIIIEPSHDETNKMICVPSEDSDQPGHPSAQSDQSLHCPLEERLGPKLPIKHTAKTDQTGWMPRQI